VFFIESEIPTDELVRDTSAVAIIVACAIAVIDDDVTIAIIEVVLSSKLKRF